METLYSSVIAVEQFTYLQNLTIIAHEPAKNLKERSAKYWQRSFQQGCIVFVLWFRPNTHRGPMEGISTRCEISENRFLGGAELITEAR